MCFGAFPLPAAYSARSSSEASGTASSRSRACHRAPHGRAIPLFAASRRRLPTPVNSSTIRCNVHPSARQARISSARSAPDAGAREPSPRGSKRLVLRPTAALRSSATQNAPPSSTLRRPARPPASKYPARRRARATASPPSPPCRRASSRRRNDPSRSIFATTNPPASPRFTASSAACRPGRLRRLAPLLPASSYHSPIVNAPSAAAAWIASRCAAMPIPLAAWSAVLTRTYAASGRVSTLFAIPRSIQPLTCLQRNGDHSDANAPRPPRAAPRSDRRRGARRHAEVTRQLQVPVRLTDVNLGSDRRIEGVRDPEQVPRPRRRELNLSPRSAATREPHHARPRASCARRRPDRGAESCSIRRAYRRTQMLPSRDCIAALRRVA